MKINDLFWVYTGSKLDFAKQTQDDTGINFVSRISNNNGVVGRVLVDTTAKIYKAGDITVPLGGSLLSCFVQDEDFVTAQNVAVLRAKKPMPTLEKWFYCYALRENRFKFSAFGREVNKYIKDIELPDFIPSWVANGDIDNISTENLISNVTPLNIDSWEYFPISGKNGIFIMESCKCSNAGELLEDGNDIDYIGAKKDDNGVMRRVKNNEELTTKGNCIVFICDGQGSVGYTNFIENDFIGSTTLSVGRNPRLNRYNALFLVTVLDRERYRYSFGRKYKTNLSKAKILLPTKDNSPDWDYMECYIKSLPYGDNLAKLQ